MNGDRRSKVIETVQKLIVHQQSAGAMGSRAEAEAFAVKIAALMRQYRLERHEVEPSVIDGIDFRDYGVTLVQWYVTDTERGVPWQAWMFGIIADSFACQTVLMKESRGRFFVAGQTVDRAVSIAVARTLCASVDVLCQDAYRADVASIPAIVVPSFATFAESYRSGFMQAVKERLAAEDAKAIEGSTGEALMVLKGAVQRTAKYLEKQTRGEIGKMDVTVEIGDRAAARKGYADGMKADLGAAKLEAGEPVKNKEIAK